MAEFPNEITDGVMAMSIIPFSWINVDEFNNVSCMWPKKLKGNKELTNAVINKIEINAEDSVICKINIKYKTSK